MDDSRTDDSWYVDEQHQILRGEAARAAIESRSDAAYLSPDQGIVRVPRERWQVAQTFERHGWMHAWRAAADDRNYNHAREFDGYRALAGQQFRHALELGCGPFTNLRVIGETTDLEACSLLDPLLENYLAHPNCSYSRAALRVRRRWCGDAFRRRGWRQLANGLARVAPAAVLRTIPVVELFSLPIEEMPSTSARYDLIVMINVIEHCYDIEQIFATILRLSAPQGWFVFADKYYHHEQVASLVGQRYYEAGHPLMVDRQVIDRFLKTNFETRFQRVVTESVEHIRVLADFQSVYFIGQRRG